MFVLFVNFPRDLVDRGFMQRFVHPDEIAEVVVFDHDADVGYVRDAEDLAPAGALAEDFQVFRAVDIGSGMVEIRSGGQLQNIAAAEFKERENRHVSGGHGHSPVEIFPHAVDGVHGDGRNGAAAKQLDLVRLLFLFKVAEGVLLAPLPARKHEVQIHDAPHFVLDADVLL